MSVSVIKNFVIVLAIGLYVSGLSFTHSQFQGKVKFQVTEGGKSTVLNYFVKGKKFRMETPENKGAFIFDSEASKMLILMDDQKMYMEIPFDMKDAMKESNEKSKGDFIATGEKKEILGYTCEKFLYNDEDVKNEIWLTKELGGFMFFNDPQQMKGSEMDWQNKLLAEGYFPMAVKELNSSGEVKSIFEVKGLEKMELNSSMFAVPSGYQKFQMPNMNSEK